MKQDRLKRKHRAAGWVWAAAGCVLAAAALGAAPASAAVLVLDDFTSGPLDAVLNNRSDVFNLIESGAGEQAGTMLGGARQIRSGIRFVPPGQVALAVNTTNGAFRFQWMQAASATATIRYGTEVSLTGNAPLNADWRAFEALELVIDEVVGAAEVVIHFTDTAGELRDARFQEVTQAGVFRASLADLAAPMLPFDSEPLDLGSIRDLSVFLGADTADGRVVISEIRLVPEPGAVGVLMLGAAALFRRQRG